MEITDIIKTISHGEITRNKNVIAGTSEFVNQNMVFYGAQGFYKIKNQKYIPSLFTVVNEAIVNCCDHAISCINKHTIQHKMNPRVGQRNVDNINMSITKTGIITIQNDGYGIPVLMGRQNYIPIECFTIPNTGSNTEKDKYRITGGTNGSGAKIITMYSSVSIIECCDGIKNFSCRITSNEKGELDIGEPVITDAIDNNQFTRIKFKIDWEHTKYKKFNDNVYKLFLIWMRTRCIHISLYLNLYRPCSITLNKKEYKMKFSDIKCEKVYSTEITMSLKDEKSLGYNNSMFGTCKIYINIVDGSSKPLKLSIINGIEIKTNPILDDVITKLYLTVKADVLRDAKVELLKKMFTSKLMLIFVGTIMNPQWVGQTKDGITRSDNFLNKYNINYDGVKELSKYFTEYLITKQSSVIKNKLKGKVENEKYSEAGYVKNRQRGKETYLWLAEGDSAVDFVRKLIGESTVTPNMKFTFENSGMLSLGGVIINTYHRMKLHKSEDFQYVKGDDKSMLVMDKKCLENKFITSFIQAMGIKMDCQYTTEKEINSLNYKKIIVASDQDKDGYNINGLFLVLASKIPGLFMFNRVYRFQTPVARLKPKNVTKANINNITEFFTEYELEHFLSNNNVPNQYHIKYYKGLAGHEDEYIAEIAKNVDKYLYLFLTSKRSEELLGIYYDKKNPDLRKEELRTPVRKMFKKELDLYKQKKITISTFLQIYVKDYQLDNLSRKLPKLLDGQNNVCGKLIYACPSILGNNELRISIIGSKITEKTKYHHGEASIQETIFKNAQTFPGKKLYPLLLGVGGIGSRNMGGKDHGSARYVTAKLNHKTYDAFFNKEDNILLEYIQCEGGLIEPKYYYPVLPLAILENYKTTAHGWKVEIWGRDLLQTKNAVISLLNNKIPTKELQINPRITANKLIHAEFENGDTVHYSKGEYKIIMSYGRPTMVITDLPIGIWPVKYIADITNDCATKTSYDDIIDKTESISNYSVDDKVHIEITLVKDWESKIPKYEDNIFTDVELHFKLRVRLCSELNFISPEGGVISFNRYIDFVIHWYEIRKKYYILRINRQIEILMNKVLKIRNVYNYLKNFHAWGLGKRITNAESHAIMLEKGLVMLNNSLVEPPLYIPTDKIRSFVLITEEGVDKQFDEFHHQELISGYASFEYLDSIRNDHMRSEKMRPLELKLVKLQTKLDELCKPNKWKYVWAEEIKHLVSTLKENSQC